MNATCWSSLTGLCKHLGKEGLCVVDETEKGWFVQYIDRDPKLRAKQEAMESRQVAELDEQERVQLAIEAQREAARQALGIDSDAESEGATELVKAAGDAPLSLSMNLSAAAGGVYQKRPIGGVDASEGGGAAVCGPPLKRVAAVFGDDDDEEEAGNALVGPKGAAQDSAAISASSMAPSYGTGGSVAVSALESIRQDEERRKQALLVSEESRNRKDYWVHPGIVVKVLNKKVSDGKYYKLKADVVRVIDDYVGEVKVHNLNSILQLDQQDLETVIPKVIIFS
jgi:DNA/RNA-binding protein KIN17